MKNQQKHHKQTEEDKYRDLKRTFEYLQEHARGQAYKLTAKGLELLAKLKEKPKNLHETT